MISAESSKARARSTSRTRATGAPWLCSTRRRSRFSAPAPRRRFAARYLAREDATTATICGCGEQGRIQLTALLHVCNLRTAFAWDDDAEAARAFARRMTAETGVAIQAVDDLGAATRASDTIVTCTTAREPFLGQEHVRPGTFVAAIGADNPVKSELKPELMANATVVVDVLEQASFMGDLHHAIAAGAMTAADVHAELGVLVTGDKPGRREPEEITIFDSTGTGIQDVAAASRAYELARERGVGLACALGRRVNRACYGPTTGVAKSTGGVYDGPGAPHRRDLTCAPPSPSCFLRS